MVPGKTHAGQDVLCTPSVSGLLAIPVFKDSPLNFLDNPAEARPMTTELHPTRLEPRPFGDNYSPSTWEPSEACMDCIEGITHGVCYNGRYSRTPDVRLEPLPDDELFGDTNTTCLDCDDGLEHDECRPY